MKKKINRNFFWAETFINELTSIGVKYACISPGSRNTPLTLAIAGNKKIKSFVHIDERSSAFFALGVAKATNTPVVIVSTSGTATAELYPAIIEAYQQRVPLIVCTADRPPELLNTGANQTINQNNLYKNHIRWFVDVGLPELIPRRIRHIKVIAKRAVYESLIHSKGPVHLNFPFRKPFEPDDYTDEIYEDIIKTSEVVLPDKKKLFEEAEKDIVSEKWFKEVAAYLSKYKKGLIIAGPENYNKQFHKNCQKLAYILGYPVLADGASQLRFGKHNKDNILFSFEGFLRSLFVNGNYKPEIIIQFGRTVTSKALELYLEKCTAIRFMINEYGDWFDPANRSNASFACKPFLFCEKMVEHFGSKKMNRNLDSWLKLFEDADKLSLKIKNKIISNSEFPNECRIIEELVDILPENSNLMISNSMPIRDFDYFAPVTQKDITVFNNRGASGIDGITSTALGLAVVEKTPTILLTGDSAFYYDMNGLLAAKKYKIPLIIVLINNNGGGIFEVLPVSKFGKVFKEFFVAPHDLDFSPFTKAFEGYYSLIKSWGNFRTEFTKALERKEFSVLEIKTNAAASLKLRQTYWNEVNKSLNKI
ncbi:MAG: 2-succinyl-5-enolpyruvyl-6-hydroxy-3-cyclohexene-1-carboxylic-acid synthase [Ignavibacteria bacterium RBG_16_34_14]|nr:MAG: 2-succinyl-5-enolpyruvyl-6-hydroxy-3-cyclohexene-1-carboxylic-acid synthase [Ignavibacteria bacterium RBG_16_34_14]